MRQLKTPEEIIKNSDMTLSSVMHSKIIEMIKAAQRDALECVKTNSVTMAPIDGSDRIVFSIELDDLENLIPK